MELEAVEMLVRELWDVQKGVIPDISQELIPVRDALIPICVPFDTIMALQERKLNPIN